MLCEKLAVRKNQIKLSNQYGFFFTTPWPFPIMHTNWGWDIIWLEVDPREYGWERKRRKKCGKEFSSRCAIFHQVLEQRSYWKYHKLSEILESWVCGRQTITSAQDVLPHTFFRGIFAIHECSIKICWKLNAAQMKLKSRQTDAIHFVERAKNN